MTLRAWREEDIPAVVEMCQDPEIPRWTTVPSPYTEEHARDFVLHGVPGRDRQVQRAIVDADSGELLGSIGLFSKEEGVGEVGYWLAAHARGRGIATRAVKLMCRWAFDEFSLARMQLHTLPGNAASERVAERAGFKREGVLRQYAVMKGERTDITMFSLLPGEL
ncbi:MAG TPA: GNAT family N-acetyltransferase [Thermoleophilaceae bacterium]|nr:GNAT family N-acetyltransferase [Thermoleophilaceae bacterium]